MSQDFGGSGSRQLSAPVRLGLLLLLALLAAVPAAAQELQIIELRYRLADEVIPIVEPLLEPGGVLTGQDAVLFVRTSPANLEQIREAVAALDRKPRQLLVTVGQGAVSRATSGAISGSATVGDEDVRVGVNRPPGSEPGATVQGRYGTQREDLHDLSSVRTLEGTETWIAVGQSALVRSTEVVPAWPVPVIGQTTSYRDVSTGFYATARLSGDLVTVEISPQQQRFRGDVRDRSVETAGITSRVSGRLGEWLPVGATTSSSRGDTTGVLVWSTQDDSSHYAVWVKVEEVP